MSSKNEFRTIDRCQKLYASINELQSTADKSYRYTICQDLRKKSEDLIHLIRKANSIRPGYDSRIKMQLESLELLEQIQDIIGVACKLLKTGAKREAQIEKDIEDVKKLVKNWIESDNKIRVSAHTNRMHSLSWELFRYKEIKDFLSDYIKDTSDERLIIAYEEVNSRYRVTLNDYYKSIVSYDRAMKALREIQSYKDDSVLAQVMNELSNNGVFSVSDIKLKTTYLSKDKYIKSINNEFIKGISSSFDISLSNSTVAKLTE